MSRNQFVRNTSGTCWDSFAAPSRAAPGIETFRPYGQARRPVESDRKAAMSAPCLNAPWFPSPSGSTPGTAGDVATLRWPQETQRRVDLRAVDLPRLLVVGHDEPAPVIVADLEDWGRVPADRDDLEARRQARRAGGNSARNY